jgi:hypothetical protein
MATDKPRITISLETETYNTVRRLAEVKSQAMSSIISELVEQAHPSLRRLLTMFEAADVMGEDAKRALLTALNDQEVRVARAYEDSVTQMDLLASKQRKTKPKGSTSKK